MATGTDYDFIPMTFHVTDDLGVYVNTDVAFVTIVREDGKPGLMSEVD